MSTIDTPRETELAPPFTIEVDEYRQAALDWVNYVRGVLSREALNDLRPADPGSRGGNSHHCPIATSVREPGDDHAHSWTCTQVWTPGEARPHCIFTAETPTLALTFAKRFDAGKYRDLEAPP